MKKRQVKKIVKLYSDSWWKIIEDTKTKAWFLNPPAKWRQAKVLKEYHRSRLRNDGLYYYRIPEALIGNGTYYIKS